MMQWLTHQLSGLGPVQVRTIPHHTSLYRNTSDTHHLPPLARSQGNVNYAHHYWEATYSEAPCKSVFTRFEGESHRLYELLDAQLGRSKYVALDRPTIADYAFYPWVAIAGFGKLDISKYKNVTRWCDELNNDADVKKADGKLPKK